MSDSPELAAIRARDAGYERCDDWAKASADRRTLLRMLDEARKERADCERKIASLTARENEAWALLTDVRFCGRNGLHDDIDKWLAKYPANRSAQHGK